MVPSPFAGTPGKAGAAASSMNSRARKRIGSSAFGLRHDSARSRLRNFPAAAGHALPAPAPKGAGLRVLTRSVTLGVSENAETPLSRALRRGAREGLET